MSPSVDVQGEGVGNGGVLGGCWCDSQGLVMGAGLTVCLTRGSGEGFCLNALPVQRKGGS